MATVKNTKKTQDKKAPSKAQARDAYESKRAVGVLGIICIGVGAVLGATFG